MNNIVSEFFTLAFLNPLGILGIICLLGSNTCITYLSLAYVRTFIDMKYLKITLTETIRINSNSMFENSKLFMHFFNKDISYNVT